MPPRPSVPNKCDADNEKLERAVRNEQFLEDLRVAIRNRGKNLKTKDLSKPLTERTTDAAEAPPLPPRTNYKKLLPQSKDFYSENPENLDLPSKTLGGQGKVFNPVVTKQSRMLPVTKIQSPETLLKLPTEEVKKRGLDSSDHNLFKVPIQTSLLSPSISGVVPRPEKTKLSRIEPKPEVVFRKFENRSLPGKIVSIPRPPKHLLKLEINDTSSSNLPKLFEKIQSEQEYFDSCIDRDVAENLLSKSFGDGTYLVRPSTQFYRTLSVIQAGKVYHIGINKDGDGLLLKSIMGTLKFKDLHELINHFKVNPLVVKGKANQAIAVYLRKALLKGAT